MSTHSQGCLDAAERALKLAHERGAREAEIYVEAVEHKSANVEQNALKGASVATHEAMGIRVFAGTNALASGFAYVNRLDDRTLRDAVDDALAIARASQPDEHNGVSAPRPLRAVPDLYADATAQMSIDTVVAHAAELLARTTERDARLSIDNGSFSVSTSSAAVVNSRGVRAHDSETGISYGLFGMAVDGDDVGSFDMSYAGCRKVEDIDISGCVDAFASRALSYLAPKSAKSYSGAVVFSAEAFEEIFLDALLSSVDGDAVWRGKSRLLDKLGQRIASPGLTVVDDGTAPGAIGSSSFDREGMPHRRNVIVGDGVLHRFLYDSKTARRQHTASTGNAQGDARSMPSIGTTNLTVAAGGVTEADLLLGLPKAGGLYVGRFSGNVDPISGDFSGVAKGSFWVRRGNKVHAVRETLVSGNVFAALQQIGGVGNVLHRNMTTQCPWVLVDGVAVTAGT